MRNSVVAEEILETASSLHIRLAVVIYVLSSDGRLLLTRRGPHMRTFPNVWVSPGGGLEAGEELQQAGVREVLEETGITVDPQSVSIFGIFEVCVCVCVCVCVRVCARANARACRAASRPSCISGHPCGGT
jgi:8-oxo-dGTP pyrophosphatase MutT (NUDIX family)